jgi:hypothetical protein
VSAARTPKSEPEIARPNSAVAIGRPAATIVPNVTSKMTAAAMMPMTSLDASGGASSPGTNSPPTAMRSPAGGWSAIATSVSPVLSGTSSGRRSSGRRTTAVVPSGDTCASRAGGAEPIPSSASARCRTRSAACCTDRSRTSRALHTTSTAYCERPSKRSRSTVAAALDSEPGVE